MYKCPKLPHLPSKRSNRLVCGGVNDAETPGFRTNHSLSLIRDRKRNGNRAPHFFTGCERVLNCTVIHILSLNKLEQSLFKFKKTREY